MMSLHACLDRSDSANADSRMDEVRRLIVTIVQQKAEAREARHVLQSAQETNNRLVEAHKSLHESYSSSRKELDQVLWVTLPAQKDSQYSVIGPIRQTIVESADQIGRWKIGSELGRGQFSVVHQALDIETHLLSAIKIISKKSMRHHKSVKTVCLEIQSMMQCGSHPNIISLQEFIHAPEKIYLVQELADWDLFQYLGEQGNDKPEEDEVREIAFGIVKGLVHLHKNGICHRDLKPENILVSGLKPGAKLTYKNIKIGDLGCCGAKASSLDYAVFEDFVGTPGFFAPELLFGRGHYDGYKADSWSLGCIILEMMLGYTTFSEIWMDAYNEAYNEDRRVFQRKIMEAYMEVQKRIPDDYMGDFVKQLIYFDEHDRTKVSELENHPWFDCIKNRESAAQKSLPKSPKRRCRYRGSLMFDDDNHIVAPTGPEGLPLNYDSTLIHRRLPAESDEKKSSNNMAAKSSEGEVSRWEPVDRSTSKQVIRPTSHHNP
jgi:serine/threonine protein kinase